MERILAYTRYFSKHPPTHELIAGFVGYKPPIDPKDVAKPPELPMMEE